MLNSLKSESLEHFLKDKVKNGRRLKPALLVAVLGARDSRDCLQALP